MLTFEKYTEQRTIWEAIRGNKIIGFIEKQRSGNQFEIVLKHSFMDDHNSDFELRKFDSLDTAKLALIESEVRREFWNRHPELKERHYVPGRSQNWYNPYVRTTFVDWIDQINKDGEISDETAAHVTL